MATVRKVLGQSAPAADTDTELYAVPSSTDAVVSALVVANRSAVSSRFRAWVEINGAATADAQYIAYDVPIEGNETVSLAQGVTMDATDTFNVRADDATLSFSLFGQETA